MNSKNKTIVIIVNLICLALSIFWLFNSKANLEPLILIISFIGTLIITLIYKPKGATFSIENKAIIRGNNNEIGQSITNSDQTKSNKLEIEGNDNKSTQLNK
ncbi:MAG: hypothetical protein R3E32_07800 [Chitinophagales bacterium]